MKNRFFGPAVVAVGATVLGLAGIISTSQAVSLMFGAFIVAIITLAMIKFGVGLNEKIVKGPPLPVENGRVDHGRNQEAPGTELLTAARMMRKYGFRVVYVHDPDK